MNENKGTSKGVQQCDTMSERPPVKAVLENSFHRQLERSEAMKVLLDVIPWHLLNFAQEEALYRYFSERH